MNLSSKNIVESKDLRRMDTTKSNKSDESLSSNTTGGKMNWRDYFNNKELAKVMT
jgi:hypothetical protein